jgi:hypothetical protein
VRVFFAGSALVKPTLFHNAVNQHLIWNDLSTTNSVLYFVLHSFFFLQEAARVAVEEAITTIDHSASD